MPDGVYTARDAASAVVSFAVFINSNGELEVKHRVTSSVLPTGAATDATLATLRDRLPAALGPGGGVKVDLAMTALTGLGTESTLAALRALVGAEDDLPATGPTDETTLIAFTKAILARIDGPSTALFAGQNAAVTEAGVALGASQACRWVMLIADAANDQPIYYGTASAKFMPVPAATEPPVKLSVANVNLLYLRSASGTQAVNWLAGS